MRIRVLALVLLAGSAAAQDLPAGEPADVRIGLSSGAVVNWTRMTVEARRSYAGSGVAGGQPATEQIVRNQVGPFIQKGAPEVRATSDITVGDLLREPELGRLLENRFNSWEAAESTYFASGRIELLGQLDLRAFLRPWTMQHDLQTPLSPTVSEWTGVVVDARGTGVLPAFSPQLFGHDDGVLWDGRLWRGAASLRSPVVWVNDPAHPAVDRAGSNPLLVRAAAGRGADLVLDETGTAQVRAHLLGTAALGEGRVVVVVDP